MMLINVIYFILNISGVVLLNSLYLTVWCTSAYLPWNPHWRTSKTATPVLLRMKGTRARLSYATDAMVRIMLSA